MDINTMPQSIHYKLSRIENMIKKNFPEITVHDTLYVVNLAANETKVISLDTSEFNKVVILSQTGVNEPFDMKVTGILGDDSEFTISKPSTTSNEFTLDFDPTYFNAVKISFTSSAANTIKYIIRTFKESRG